jgi:hypothetical protein
MMSGQPHGKNQPATGLTAAAHRGGLPRLLLGFRWGHLFFCLGTLLSVGWLGTAGSSAADSVFEESFESFDPSRFLTKIPNRNTEVRGGVLWTRGESGGKYPPMVYLPIAGRDLEIRFRYRHLGEGGWLWFFVDGDDGFGSVDHMLRIKLLRDAIQLQIDSHTLDAKHPLLQAGRAPDPVSRAYRLNERFPPIPLDLRTNVWRELRLRFHGSTVDIALDAGGWQHRLEHPGFDAAKRKLLWMQNGGAAGLELDDIHVTAASGRVISP